MIFVSYFMVIWDCKVNITFQLMLKQEKLDGRVQMRTRKRRKMKISMGRKRMKWKKSMTKKKRMTQRKRRKRTIRRRWTRRMIRKV